MITKLNYEKCWRVCLGNKKDENINPYAEEGVIPIGTRRPYYEYDGNIPPEEIVFIHFDGINTPFTQREALNILMLAGSGDGKSLQMKNIWATLHDAGYYCIYIDPKQGESTRAKSPNIQWSTDRIAPALKPKGIKLRSYMPTFATKYFEQFAHNFKIYALRLGDFDEKEIWQGLGVTPIASSKVAKIIYNNKHITLKKLYARLNELQESGELKSVSLEAVYSRLVDLEDFNFIDDNIPEIDLMKDFREGYSVTITYNSRERIFMGFDVGEKVKRCVKFFAGGNRNPIMFFFDDSSFYAQYLRNQSYNYAIEEIMNIGFNYRSMGIYNCMAVQTLSIIDEKVAETYKIKLLSPKFQNPDGLAKIGIPKEVIFYLKAGELMIDDANKTMEWVAVFSDGSFVRYFPFMPNCNHFKEVLTSASA